MKYRDKLVLFPIIIAGFSHIQAVTTFRIQHFHVTRYILGVS